MRAGIALRVSTEDQVRKYGLLLQERACTDYCAAQGYAVVALYRDEGFSGTDRTRPGLKQLLADARARRLDVAVFYDTTRLARGLLNQLLVEDALRRAGVKVEFATFTVEDTPEGRLAQNVRGIIGEFEREKFRERTSRGRIEKARRGKVPSAPTPFGYIREATAPSGVAIEATAATWVRRIFAWVLEGASLRTIRARLAAQGCPTPRGGPWAHSTLRKLVRCEHYVGRAWYNRRTGGKGSTTFRDAAEWIEIAVPPIISRATFDRAQAQLRRHVALLGGQPPQRVYLLGGLLTCGRCGRRLRGDVEHGRTLVYRCAGRRVEAEVEGPRCRFRILACRVDDAVWTTIVGIIRDPGLFDSTAKQARLGLDAHRVDAQTELAVLERAAKTVATKRNRLRDLYIDGRLDRAAFDARERPLAAEEARVQAERARVAALVASGRADADRQAAMLAYCRLIARNLDGLDDRGRKELLCQIVTGVVVSPDGLDVQGLLPLGPDHPPPPGRELVTTQARCAHRRRRPRGRAWHAVVRARRPDRRSKAARSRAAPWRPPWSEIAAARRRDAPRHRLACRRRSRAVRPREPPRQRSQRARAGPRGGRGGRLPRSVGRRARCGCGRRARARRGRTTK
jgi:site-specific DNA recombinase